MGTEKIIYIICLSLVLITVITFGIYRYNAYKLKSINTSANRYSASINKVGNANYFNPKDGIYYADSKYSVVANDNTAYLLSLFKSESLVNLPAGNFLCKTKLVLKGKELSVIGIEGKSKIVFDSKTFSNSGVGSYSECLIINNNYDDEYHADSAQSINISKITFEYKRYSNNSPVTIMLFKNIKSANIKNCSFIADLPNGIAVTNLDFYNACKNVTVSNCSFINKTKSSDGGGCIWVRNLTTQTQAVEGNTTEDIYITKCSFVKDSKDEVIAVFSVTGDVKDVVISHCDIKDYSNKQDIILSVFSSEDKYYGVVDNVIINRNNIYTENFNAFVILTGIENLKKPTSNVIIANNKIVSNSKNNSRKTIIYNAGNNTASNIVVNNNEINVTGSNYFAAVAGATYAEGNKITGALENGVYGGAVINNFITGAVNGIVNPMVAFKNEVLQVVYGIRVYEEDSCINSNKIELNRTDGVSGVQINSLKNVTCTENSIRIFSNKQYGVITNNTVAVLSNNEVIV